MRDIKFNIDMTAARTMIPFDAIYSSRVKMAGRIINRNSLRHLISRIVTTIFGFTWKKIPYDTQSGFKIYRNSDDFKSLFTSSFRTRWFFDIELTIKYLENTERELKVWEQPVSSWSDVPGSKINLSQVKNLFFEIIYIQFRLFRLRKLFKIN